MRGHPRPALGPQTVEPSELPHLAIGDDDGSGPSDLEIRGVLGEGGMGIVELARQRSLSRDVAVKRLRPGMADERAVRGLLAEATFTGYLEHPRSSPCTPWGVTEGSAR